ncbi:MAG: cyclic nucleotide-binding domain-containing protein, partial [Myxococcaceae bacterium]
MRASVTEASERKEWVRRLWPAASFQFAFVAAIAVLKSAANALVLARFQAGALPFLYLAAAGTTVALTAVAATRRDRPVAQPVLLSMAGAALAVFFAVGIHFKVSASALLVYLFAESFATYLAIAFWKSLDDAFDPREARRAFTAVAGIGMVGGVAGGLLAQVLARRIGANALLGAGALLLVMGGVAFRFHRAQRQPAPLARKPRGDVLAFLRGHGYARPLTALVFSLAVLSAFADYLFRHRAAQTLGEDELAALFGNLQLWIGLFGVVFQLLLAEQLLRRLGLLRYLALVPLVLAPLAAATVVEAALWPAYLLKLVEAAASLAILPVGMQLLYAPVPDDLRDGVRSAMDGAVKKGGLALGGILLIGAGGYAAGPAAGAAVLALCLAAAFALARLRPAYLAALQERVTGVGLAPEAALEGVERRLLVDALRSNAPERVLHAVTLMQHGSVELRPHVPLLLEHGNERVLEKGVQLALELGATEYAPKIEALLQSEHRRPRDEAAWALARLAPARAAQVLPPLLQAPDIGLRCAAIGALLGLEGGYPAELALQGLAARGEVAPVSERREVARLLGRLRDERWAEILSRYLGDGDSSVRRIAIAAVGEGGYASLAARLLPFLTWREERRVAREALARLGDLALPLVSKALNDRGRPQALRYELPRVLRQIGTQQALEALLFSNVRDDAFLHYRIGVALVRLREGRPDLKVDATRVREAIDRRREHYQLLVGPFRDVRAALGDSSLLTRAVGNRLDQTSELTFWLLGLIYDARALRRVHQHLVGGDPRRRAYALELLENMVPPEDQALVHEQTEAHHRDLPVGASGRLSEHLGGLCHSDDNVLRACARQVARGVGLWSLPTLEDDMSEATVKRMFSLEGVEIFAQSDVDDIAAVAALAREQRFRKGERIYSEGDPGDALYVILQGKVDAIHAG